MPDISMCQEDRVVAGADAARYRPIPGFVLSTTTDPDGAYILSNLPPGPYLRGTRADLVAALGGCHMSAKRRPERCPRDNPLDWLGARTMGRSLKSDICSRGSEWA